MSELINVYETMPKKVRVGFSTYEIRIMDKDSGDINGICGSSHAIKQVITITDQLVPQQVANTFLHEIIHAVHHQFGLMQRETPPSEEEWTNLTTNGLSAFMQDNPDAMLWIMETLSQE
jgi:hypothetical protein